MKSIKWIAFLVLLSVSSAATAEYTHYMGADLNWKSVSLRGFNKELFAKHSPGANVYTGVRIDDLWGFEFGMHGVRTKKRSAATRVNSIHLNLLGIYSLSPSVDMIGGIGLAHIKYTASHPAIRIDASRVVPRVLTGFEFRVIDYVKLRTTFQYESALSMKRKTHAPRASYGVTAGIVFGV